MPDLKARRPPGGCVLINTPISPVGQLVHMVGRSVNRVTTSGGILARRSIDRYEVKHEDQWIHSTLLLVLRPQPSASAPLPAHLLYYRPDFLAAFRSAHDPHSKPFCSTYQPQRYPQRGCRPRLRSDFPYSRCCCLSSPFLEPWGMSLGFSSQYLYSASLTVTKATFDLFASYSISYMLAWQVGRLKRVGRPEQMRRNH